MRMTSTPAAILPSVPLCTTPVTVPAAAAMAKASSSPRHTSARLAWEKSVVIARSPRRPRDLLFWPRANAVILRSAARHELIEMRAVRSGVGGIRLDHKDENQRGGSERDTSDHGQRIDTYGDCRMHDCGGNPTFNHRPDLYN